MKQLSLIILLLNFFVISSFSQVDDTLNKVKVHRDESIFLKIDDNNKLKYFYDPEKPIDRSLNNICFSIIDESSCNIYMKWVNPLRYKLILKDSLFSDQRDVIIQDFLTLLLKQFPTFQDSLKNVEKFIPEINNDSSFYSIDFPEEGFNDLDLNHVLYILYSIKDDLKREEIILINRKLKILKTLENISGTDNLKKVNSHFEALFSVDSIDTYNRLKKEIDNDIVKIKQTFKIYNDNQEIIFKEINMMEFSDTNLHFASLLIKSYVVGFLYRSSQKLKNDQEILNQFQKVIDICKQSTLNPYNKTDFFMIKTIDLEKGKITQTDIKLVEYELVKNLSELNSIKKQKNIYTGKLFFEKYDPIHVWVSTGLFFTKISETEFGVANNDTGQFVVTENSVKKNRYGPALYLNFKINCGSRYLAPIFQLGIDPTKEKPFLLLGGGFCIPSSNFSITAGPIWKWNPILSKYTVGDVVPSSSHLKSDIKYEFDVVPKGWFLGLQYKIGKTKKKE